MSKGQCNIPPLHPGERYTQAQRDRLKSSLGALTSNLVAQRLQVSTVTMVVAVTKLCCYCHIHFCSSKANLLLTTFDYYYYYYCCRYYYYYYYNYNNNNNYYYYHYYCYYYYYYDYDDDDDYYY